MRIAFLAFFRGGLETGVYRKVREQAAAWAAQGITVGLFVGTDPSSVNDWSLIPQAVRIDVLPSSAALTLATRERLVLAVRRWRPDAVYTRNGLVHPGLVGLVRRHPTIVEVNADDLAEHRLQSAWKAGVSAATRGLLLGRAAGLVFVTGELANSRSFARFRRPGRVVANGIDLSAHPPFPVPSNELPHLIFVGHPRSPWHGVEHVLEMATLFPHWHFDLIGPSRAELANAPANVVVHGVLKPVEVATIMAHADVAIGTLALYREGLHEASPLKVREYLARGIPTIIGYKDTDFPDQVSFLLEIPNAPGAVMSSTRALSTFVERAIGTRVSPGAIEHLDATRKEAGRLAFIRKVAGTPR
jgi:hypothetical protein